MDVVLIGAGNVATHLGAALQRAGHRVVQVYSRTQTSADALAAKLDCTATTSIDDVSAAAQVYIFALKDAVLEEVAKELREVLQKKIGDVGGTKAGDGAEEQKNAVSSALFLHTAGSLPVDALTFEHRGVLYPMQTFSKTRNVDFAEIPLFIESETDSETLLQLATSLSSHVFSLNSEQRKRLHLAAVFACNFANHMYDLSAQLLAEAGLPFDVMLPLVDETARKVHELSPRQAQTGPAVRYDENVMEKHLSMLDGDARKQQLYELISKSIHDDQLRPQQD